jgi:hypothetical protein
MPFYYDVVKPGIGVCLHETGVKLSTQLSYTFNHLRVNNWGFFMKFFQEIWNSLA